MPTIDVLQTLQQEVGSRRAGTEGEQRAQEWLKTRCESLGLRVEFDEFTFVGSERYISLLQIVISGLVLTCLALAIAGYPLLCGVGLILVLIYMEFVHQKLDVRLARTHSRNIIAGLRRPISEYISAPNKGPAVLLCAHYDTPRNVPGWYRYIRELQRYVVPLGLLGIVLYIIYTILYGLGRLLGMFGISSVQDFLLTVPFIIVVC